MKGNYVRGIRNNNPFNIKRSSHPWIGKLNNPTDSVFEQFETMELGVRAGLKLLSTYVKRGFDTPERIVKRFAPTSENNIDNYINFICVDSCGYRYIQPDEHIVDLRTLCSLASRMVKYECALTSIQQWNFLLTCDDLVKVFLKYNLKID